MLFRTYFFFLLFLITQLDLNAQNESTVKIKDKTKIALDIKEKEKIIDIILQIKSEIGKPYQSLVSPTILETSQDAFTNFLRNGPKRKVFLIYYGDGDFQYDPKMTQDQEIEIDLRNKKHFEFTLQEANKILGPPSKLSLPKNIESVLRTNRNDISKQGKKFDNINWTAEYEYGALFRGEYSGDTRFWETKNEYIFLESDVQYGDDEFFHYTVFTISPKLK